MLTVNPAAVRAQTHALTHQQHPPFTPASHARCTSRATPTRPIDVTASPFRTVLKGLAEGVHGERSHVAAAACGAPPSSRGGTRAFTRRALRNMSVMLSHRDLALEREMDSAPVPASCWEQADGDALGTCHGLALGEPRRGTGGPAKALPMVHTARSH
jgi:hypothetical protein